MFSLNAILILFQEVLYVQKVYSKLIRTRFVGFVKSRLNASVQRTLNADQTNPPPTRAFAWSACHGCHPNLIVKGWIYPLVRLTEQSKPNYRNSYRIISSSDRRYLRPAIHLDDRRTLKCTRTRWHFSGPIARGIFACSTINHQDSYYVWSNLICRLSRRCARLRDASHVSFFGCRRGARPRLTKCEKLHYSMRLRENTAGTKIKDPLVNIIILLRIRRGTLDVLFVNY